MGGRGGPASGRPGSGDREQRGVDRARSAARCPGCASPRGKIQVSIRNVPESGKPEGRRGAGPPCAQVGAPEARASRERLRGASGAGAAVRACGTVVSHDRPRACRHLPSLGSVHGRTSRQSKSVKETGKACFVNFLNLRFCVCLYLQVFLRKSLPSILLESFQEMVSGPHSGSVWSC